MREGGLDNLSSETVTCNTPVFCLSLSDKE